MKRNLLLCFVVVISACGTSKITSTNTGKPTLKNDKAFLLKEISTDQTYGYTEKNPIMVGGAFVSGPENERRFLNALAGPDGERISYNRRGSCCPIKTKSGSGGMLDIYDVTWKGLDKPRVLYINMYDYEPLKAPVGFSIKD